MDEKLFVSMNRKAERRANVSSCDAAINKESWDETSATMKTEILERERMMLLGGCFDGESRWRHAFHPKAHHTLY